MPEGRNSPSPSRQSGAQIHEATGSGSVSNKPQSTKEWKDQPVNNGTEGLESNPKGPLEDEVKRKFDGVLRK